MWNSLEVASAISEAGKKIATGIVVAQSLMGAGPALYGLFDENGRSKTLEERREEFDRNVAKRIVTFYDTFSKQMEML